MFTNLDRFYVGADALLKTLEAFDRKTPETYPPYNLEKLDEDTYRVTVAVAGFSQDELSVTEHEGNLYIGTKTQEGAIFDEPKGTFLHKGIAKRSFMRTFKLGEHIRVIQADIQNGLLTVDLKREIPEEKKPKVIPFGENLKLPKG